MKKILVLSLLMLATGCAVAPQEPRPSYVEEVVRADGVVIQEYHVGYSIEDFLEDFY